MTHVTQEEADAALQRALDRAGYKDIKSYQADLFCGWCHPPDGVDYGAHSAVRTWSFLAGHE